MTTALGLGTMAIATLAIPPSPTAAQTGPGEPRSFLDWCRQPNTHPPEARRTVAALLSLAKTNDCAAAQQALAALPNLVLHRQGLSDLRPIAALRHWQGLDLTDNAIEDLSPLADLPNLAMLLVGRNRVRDVSVLGRLPNLSYAVLERNQITDVSQLRPAGGSATLRNLILLENPIAQKLCPLRPATICIFSDGAEAAFNAGTAAFERGDLAGAIAQYEAAAAVYQREGDRRREAKTHERLGFVLAQQGNLAQALAHYMAAQTSLAGLGDLPLEGSVMASLAELHERLGEYDQAQSWLSKAMANAETQAKGGIPLEGGIYELPKFQGFLSLWMARILVRQVRLDEALKAAQTSLNYYRLLPEDYPGRKSGEAAAQTTIGEIERRLGRRSEARQTLTTALATAQAADDRLHEARAMFQLGLLWQGEDDPQANAWLERGLAVAQAIGARGDEAQLLNAIGRLQLTAGRYPAAVTRLAAAVDRWESLRPGLLDDHKIAIADAQADTYGLLMQAQVAAGQPEAALVTAERARARAFVELLVARQMPGAGAANLPLASPPLSVEQIRALARAESATLVEYAIAPEALYIWVVQPDGTIHFRAVEAEAINEATVSAEPLPEGSVGRGSTPRKPSDKPGIALNFAELLDRQVRATRDAVFAPPITGNSARQTRLRRLHDQLIAPIAPLLPREVGSKVIFVPQGMLFLVPFAALRTGDGQALIDRYAPVVVPSLQVLDLTRQQQPRQATAASGDRLAGAAVVVGNPTMPKVPPRWGGTPQVLPPLPGAEAEARAIAPLLGTSLLTGKAATKAAVLAKLPQARWIHLATHGLLDDLGGAGLPGAIALAPEGPKPGAGLLSAREVMGLNLKAELVVLSACNTGRGRITGDGIVGLSRAFAAAGAASTLVTLWQIPDEPTALLAPEFYRQLATGVDKATALRRAMLATRDRFPDPLNWAAFLLVGSGE